MTRKDFTDLANDLAWLKYHAHITDNGVAMLTYSLSVRYDNFNPHKFRAQFDAELSRLNGNPTP